MGAAQGDGVKRQLLHITAVLSRRSPAKAEGQTIITENIAIIPKLSDKGGGIAHGNLVSSTELELEMRACRRVQCLGKKVNFSRGTTLARTRLVMLTTLLRTLDGDGHLFQEPL